MDHEDDQSEVQCEQCSTVPDNYVKLDCEHKFCLICLGYNYLQQQNQESANENAIQCNICESSTMLDSDTINALQMVIQDVLIPMIQQNTSENTNENKNNEQEHEEEYGDISNTAIKDEPQTYPVQEQQQFNFFENKPSQQAKENSYTQKRSFGGANYEDYPLKETNKQIFQKKIESYLKKCEYQIQVKLNQLKLIVEQKQEFQQKCSQMKEQLNEDFQQILLMIEQKRSIFINDINNIEMITLIDLKKQEQENVSQFILKICEGNYNRNLKLFSEQNKDSASAANQISQICVEIDQLLKKSDTLESQNYGHKDNNQHLFKLNLQAKLFLQQFQQNQNQRQSPKYELASQQKQQQLPYLNDNSDIQIENMTTKVTQLIKSISEKSNQPSIQQVHSKYQQSYDKQSPPKQSSSKIAAYLDKSQRQSNSKYSGKSQPYQKNYLNEKNNNWKDSIMDIFEGKSKLDNSFAQLQQKIQKKETSRVIQQEEPIYNVHKALNMQQQNYLVLKEQLMRK